MTKYFELKIEDTTPDSLGRWLGCEIENMGLGIESIRQEGDCIKPLFEIRGESEVAVFDGLQLTQPDDETRHY